MWHIETKDYRQDADNGNRFLVGNGYMGVRGTLDAHGKEQLAAVNLAGIYDRVGDGWREPLNAPYPLFTCLYTGDMALRLPELEPVSHVQSLDFYRAIAKRSTTWAVPGGNITVSSQRIACMQDCNLLASAFTVSVTAPMTLRLQASIDANIWEIYGPHYSDIAQNCAGNTLSCLAKVQKSNAMVAVGRRCLMSDGTTPVWEVSEGKSSLWYDLTVTPEHPVTLYSVCAVYTTQDASDPQSAVGAALTDAPDYGTLLAAHEAAWAKIWEVGQVEIQGDEHAQDVLNYSLYHLNAIAPRHSGNLSIPARGLSGQTYKGAIFWDSEMFILDYFLYTQPDVARSMVRYRIDTLPGAMAKAKEYGWEGAFYAWESQEGGYDACSNYNVTDVFTKRPMRTFFRDKQVHISSAVARAIVRYIQVTGDRTLLTEGGAETLLECARFYYSLLLRRANKGQWEIHDVIGPDEYHERGNNNAYTNRMALETFRWAAEAAQLVKKADAGAYEALNQKCGAEALLAQISEAAAHLYVPQPGDNGIIPQFDGYFALEDTSVEAVRSRLLDPKEYWGGAYGVAAHTQVIKQADVVTMLEMFHGDYETDILQKNWEFYEPRTEHGSSLSACMYALLACRFGAADRAYPFFLKSAQADWLGGGKQWAGLVYIGGTHPAAEGGAWKVMAEGFAGLEAGENGPVLNPCLPEGWKKLSFCLEYRNKRYRAVVTPQGRELIPV